MVDSENNVMRIPRLEKREPRSLSAVTKHELCMAAKHMSKAVIYTKTFTEDAEEHGAK